MGLFKKITNVVAAPVKAAAKTVSNVAQGDIKGAAKSAVSGVTSLSPVTQFENLSGGKLSQFANNIPFVGSPLSKFTASSGRIGGSAGDFSGSDFRQYLREGAKLGAIGTAGYFAAPSLGVTGTLTAGAIGSQAFSGNIRGALQSSIAAYTPEGFEGIGGIGQSLLQKRVPSSAPIGGTGGLNFAGSQDEGPSVLLIAGLAIGAIFLIKHVRKK